jgi:hypothetical protein
MVQRSPDEQATVATSAARIGGRMIDQLAELTASIQEFVVEQVSELHGEDPQLLELLRDNIAANIDTFFSAVHHGIPIENIAPPTVALEYARRVAQRGISANALVRGYRLGHSAVINAIVNEIRAAKFDARLSLDVFEQVSATSFRYLDWMSQQALDVYEAERDRWAANRNSTRVLRVREVLAGADVDVDAMTTTIRYPLKRCHVAIVAWCHESRDGDELAGIDRFVRDLAESIGAAGPPLVIPADRVTAWGWIPFDSKTARNAVAHMRKFAETRSDGPWLAAGDPLPSINGFRRSHAQAQAARAVATASSSDSHRFTAISDRGLALAALHGENLAGARTWVHGVLGPLASATDGDHRLRETLQVFLRTGSSFKAAADELHLHPNGVKYRVQRAEERRGRPVADDRLDVEVALLLCQWFDKAVLS